MLQCVAPYHPAYKEGVDNLFGINAFEKAPKLAHCQVLCNQHQNPVHSAHVLTSFHNRPRSSSQCKPCITEPDFDTTSSTIIMNQPTIDITAKVSPPRRHVINTLLRGYSSLSAPVLIQPLSDAFSHTVLPARLGIPRRDKAQFAQHADEVFRIFQEFQMSPLDIYEDSAQNTVIIHAEMKGKLKESGCLGNDDDHHHHECILIIKLSEDWKKVVEVKEFCDSELARRMVRRFGAKVSSTKKTGTWFRPAILVSLVAVSGLVWARKFLLSKH